MLSRRTNYQIQLENYIDRDIQSMLLPLDLIQNIFLFPKYRIKNNCIYPNTLMSNLISACGVIIFMFFFVHHIYDIGHYDYIKEKMDFAYMNSYADIFMYGIGFSINYINRLTQSTSSIMFVLKIQNVHRFLNNGSYFDRFIVSNWICMAAIVCFYLVIITRVTVIFKLSIYTLMKCFCLMCFDCNVIYAIRFIQLLTNKLHLWDIEAQHSRRLEDGSTKDYCKKMFQVYSHILECYNLFRCIFQYLIAFHSIEYFICSITRFEMTIQIFHLVEPFALNVKQHAYIYAEFWNIWVIKSFILQLILTRYCEKFDKVMENVQDSCTIILTSNCTDHKKLLCKNVQRLHRAAYSKMSVCGMFYINAVFPLKMIALLANYVIVLLQFELL